VIYNHFVEQTAYDKHGQLHDEDIFRNCEHAYDLRDAYRSCTDAAQRNRLQIATYNAANFVIGVQGGNLYLPAICKRNLFVLQRAGNYLDYPEVARVYGTEVEMFYDPRHMLVWLAETLPVAESYGSEAA
jgi:hypothetical protein